MTRLDLPGLASLLVVTGDPPAANTYVGLGDAIGMPSQVDDFSVEQYAP